MIRLPFHVLRFAALASALLLAAAPSALANNGAANGGAANGGAANGGAANGGAANGGGTGNTTVAGVSIDGQGTLRMLRPDHRLSAQKLLAAKRNLPQRLARPTAMRMVSLNRLEEAVGKRLANNEPLTPEMIAMAGLTRLEYVFFYPESGDIVIAGPAEGFAEDSLGRIVGVDSQKPCLLLDDVIVALRAFGPTGEAANVISVSIDPTQEGLARMQKTLSSFNGKFRGAQDIPVILNMLKQSLGLNEVTIKGVPATTHFAHVLTEADYRMKLIGIGLEAPPVRGMISYASRINGAAAANSLCRWFFVPDYETITANEDFTAMKLTGQGLKLVGENEVVSSDGTRTQAGRVNPASQAYTDSFTKNFPQIAEVDPIYAQLRNIVDLSIASAFIQDQDFYGKSGWDLGVFGSEDALAVETLPAPLQVETAINAIVKGRRLITPIGGGVAIQAKKALLPENLQEDDGRVAAKKEAVTLDRLTDGQWWWD